MLNGMDDLAAADLNLLVLFEAVMRERHVRPPHRGAEGRADGRGTLVVC